METLLIIIQAFVLAIMVGVVVAAVGIWLSDNDK